MSIFERWQQRTQFLAVLRMLLNRALMRGKQQAPLSTRQLGLQRDLLTLLRQLLKAFLLCGPVSRKLHLFIWGSEGRFACISPIVRTCNFPTGSAITDIRAAILVNIKRFMFLIHMGLLFLLFS
jgi:hypothetical protein